MTNHQKTRTMLLSVARLLCSIGGTHLRYMGLEAVSFVSWCLLSTWIVRMLKEGWN